MARIRLSAVAFVLVLECALAGLAFAQDPSQTVMTVCAKCHNTQRICKNLGVKDKTAWEKTVDKMILNGAALKEDQKPALVGWLAVQGPGAKPVCQ